ncbi:MAG: hypothetical protein GX259_04025 [Bacteroidales bacterium]|nr:hypothetical protein [Bacteroidales bacterium]
MSTMFFSCIKKKEMEIKSSISEKTIKAVKDSLMRKDSNIDRISKGVEQAAKFWRKEDGADSVFVNFCIENFVPTGPEYDTLFDKLNFYFENIIGSYNQMSVELMRNLHEPRGTIKPIDEMFGSWDVTAHFTEDMFNNKIAFTVLLNFPHYTLKEKNELAKTWSPRDWGKARLGDMFVARVPSDLLLKATETNVKGGNYIANYNIYMGSLLNDKKEKLFPENKVLISHWGLRDELKSNYADTALGLEKQEMIYNVMKRIIDQTIPTQVINNGSVLWNPANNEVFENDSKIETTPEPNQRYKVLLDNFKALKALDGYYPYNDNFISRKFDSEMEMAQADVEELFVSFVSSPVINDIGKLISKRLGRELRPFDIWYNGFTSRSGINEADLDKITQKLFPDNVALKKALPNVLIKLGFDADKANYISSFIDVDPAIGSGHAWGALKRTDVSHLRTRIDKSGMNYKGYNIAVHEFGHNVEQTISLHFVDNYALNGVPNTAFTEALAFVFQSRDLQLLGMKNNDPLAKDYETLEIAWSLYEIMGVSLVDMNVWKWLYEHPKTNPQELKEAVISIAKDVWNKYYAPVFGVKDEPVLAIYSHMIESPLYLSAYPIGHLIQFQLEQQLEGKDFADEVLRIYSLGRLTPDVWMQSATGKKLSGEALLNASKEALDKINNAK